MRFAGAVKFVSTILAFMAGMMLPMLITGSSPQDILNAIRLTVQAGQLTWATISKLPLSISSIILGLYLALSYFRVMDYAFEHGSISLKALLQVLPIVSWIYKWFKGYKVEDDK
jgi:tRNA U34 5-methylaminomethyl-2-thiouridine-forming methyltransferase MnmC